MHGATSIESPVTLTEKLKAGKLKLRFILYIFFSPTRCTKDPSSFLLFVSLLSIRSFVSLMFFYMYMRFFQQEVFPESVQKSTGVSRQLFVPDDSVSESDDEWMDLIEEDEVLTDSSQDSDDTNGQTPQSYEKTTGC